MNLIVLIVAILGILIIAFLAVYKLYLVKEERELIKEEALRKIVLFEAEKEAKREKRKLYMREYRKRKKEANK